MFTYFKESIEELRNNVTLPSRAEASNLMIVVAVFSILFALATWGVDTVFSELVQIYFDNILN
ncbi:MAG TPA: preprotein translocase subunit SecE [Pricia sp.]|nr:preprotein translocase subunit SecE [Pricia sp.]